MPIAINDEHQELAATVRGVLTSHKALQAARALLEADDEPRPSYWSEMAELGWLGVHLPEEHGGGGAGIPELVVVLEELGRQVAPGPFLPTVLASAVISECGSAEQKQRLLPGLADGSRTAALGLGGTDLALTQDPDRAGGTLTLQGDAGTVLGGAAADLILLRVGDDVVVVPADAPGLTRTHPPDLDPTRRSVRAHAGGVAIGTGDVIAGAAARAVALARTLAAAEAVGGAAACVEHAVAYAKERVQFGRTIGTFQAVKHHCADMMVAAELATAVVWDAARAADGPSDEFRLAAAMAATLAFEPYVHNAQMNIQVHGGIGFTWEHDAHLYLRRALALNAVLGTPADAEDVTTLTAQGTTREVTLELPPEAVQIRADIRTEAERLATLKGVEQRRALLDSGMMVPHWPRPWGREAGAVEQLLIDEQLKASGVKVPQFGITAWVIMTVNQYATPDQVERWVAKTLMGELVWCQLFSEPDAGSDAAAVKTRGVRVEGGWIVNGQKVWTSGAHVSDLGLATVRTDPDAPKHAGITTMVIDMHAPGVEVRPLRQITGDADFNEVFFNDVFVPDEDVVGVPNDGWTVARSTLGNERVSIGGGATSLLVSLDLIDLLRRHGARVPGAAARAGSVLTKEHALKALNVRSAQRAVIGAGPGPEGNVTKLVLAETGHERAVLQADLVGDNLAFLSGEGQRAAMFAMVTRAMSIAGGSSEITRNQIAERILGLPRDPLLK